MSLSMKAIVATGKGGSNVLEPRDVSLPWPAASGDVLVRLRAAAVNPADVFFRRLGGYVERPGPFILGHDGAGMPVPAELVTSACNWQGFAALGWQLRSAAPGRLRWRKISALSWLFPIAIKISSQRRWTGRVREVLMWLLTTWVRTSCARRSKQWLPTAAS